MISLAYSALLQAIVANAALHDLCQPGQRVFGRISIGL